MKYLEKIKIQQQEIGKESIKLHPNKGSDSIKFH